MPPKPVLRAMDQVDWARRSALLAVSYSRALAVARGLPVPEAEAVTARSFAQDVAQGPATPGHLMRKALVDGREIGWVWVSLPGTTRPGMAWIHNIEIDPEFRSQGHARSILEETEEDLRRQGVTRLGLNMFPDNHPALRLYERLGYQLQSQQRSRRLTEIPSSKGIELVPLVDYERRMGVLVSEYAEDLREEEVISKEEARVAAADKIKELLPDGPETPGAILRTVMAEGVEVGWVWATEPDSRRPTTGWLHDIDIDEAHRSKGYGRKVIAAIESELHSRGIQNLGLNVHGYNEGARRLYEKLGYEPVSQQMTKDLVM